MNRGCTHILKLEENKSSSFIFDKFFGVSDHVRLEETSLKINKFNEVFDENFTYSADEKKSFIHHHLS